MNQTPNVILQQSGNTNTPQSNSLRGSSERIYTAVVQLICGVTAMVCGLVLILLKTPDNDAFYGRQIPVSGKTAFGIWGGLVFIATAIPYIFGRHKKSMVALYFGFCLASAVITIVGLGLSMSAVNKIVHTTMEARSSLCYGVLYVDEQYRCCFRENRYDRDCPSYYNRHHYYSSYDNYWPGTQYPYIPYGSTECRRVREECIQEGKRMYAPHLAFHGIMIAVVSIELLASIYGAAAALSAFCSCCMKTKPTQLYPCSFNQLMANENLINTVVTTEVNSQLSRPAVISNTQVPPSFAELHPGSGPLRY